MLFPNFPFIILNHFSTFGTQPYIHPPALSPNHIFRTSSMETEGSFQLEYRAIAEPHQHLPHLQGWRQKFSDGGADSYDRGLKYGFEGAINVEISEKRIFTFRKGIACSNGGL